MIGTREHILPLHPAVVHLWGSVCLIRPNLCCPRMSRSYSRAHQTLRHSRPSLGGEAGMEEGSVGVISTQYSRRSSTTEFGSGGVFMYPPNLEGDTGGQQRASGKQQHLSASTGSTAVSSLCATTRSVHHPVKATCVQGLTHCTRRSDGPSSSCCDLDALKSAGYNMFSSPKFRLRSYLQPRVECRVSSVEDVVKAECGGTMICPHSPAAIISFTDPSHVGSLVTTLPRPRPPGVRSA